MVHVACIACHYRYCLVIGSCYAIAFVGVGGSVLLPTTVCSKVRLQISIDNLASSVSTERLWISLPLSINLFTESFDEERYIRLCMQKAHFRVACLVFNEG